MTTYARNPETARRGIAHLKNALGDQLLTLLQEPDVTDVCLNPNGKLWISRHGRMSAVEGEMSPAQADQIIAAVAATVDETATKDSPILEAELLLDGSRFSATLPPLNYTPSFSIRKHARSVFTFDDYVERGRMTPLQREILEAATARRENILICGGTGDGKSTFLNAVIGSSVRNNPPSTRYILLEELVELKTDAPNVLAMRCAKGINLRALLRHALRRGVASEEGTIIIVGEVRGAEGLDLVKALTTGHEGGASTIHCNVVRPDAALSRLELCIQEATPNPMGKLIAEAINLIVCIKAKQVTQIVRVHGWDPVSGYRLGPAS